MLLTANIAAAGVGSLLTGSFPPMEDRVERVKKSCVRILVSGKPNGTGFVIGKHGLVATCFHVVEHDSDLGNGMVRPGYEQDIEVEFSNKRRLHGTVAQFCLDNVVEAYYKDYCILKLDTNGLEPLKLGALDEVREGAVVYTCGYPYGIEQQVVGVGILSTKWQDTRARNPRATRDVAWLDIAINAGNSGGPLLLAAKDSREDVVVGVTTFNLNPFYTWAETQRNELGPGPGRPDIKAGGFSFADFAYTMLTAEEQQSLGVGACVSAKYLKAALTGGDR
jgi:S1-C subfamily serine protease